ncbi:MAG: winged helix-turn-helix domain-containing protein [Nitrososphaerales archaeon]
MSLNPDPLVIYRFLNLCRSSPTKNKLHKDSKQSYTQFKRYLEFLLDRFLIDGVTSDHVAYYSITNQGLEYLKRMDYIKETHDYELVLGITDSTLQPRYEF